ncbi:MAG: (2Fe-2S)-binding protein [Acidiferrobacteraceae bacterium]|nr:(2Fe-2S)-binding protein [Acidiferrobacteraceae bacterium]
MASQAELIKSLKKICICRSVTQGSILTAIQDGATSFEALRRKLNLGTGYCKAKRCRPKIQTILKEYKDDHKATSNL